MDELEKYYNKFNEDKRLLSRHGQVEFFVCQHYIQKLIGDRKNLQIVDIGAGTGRYSAWLAGLGHHVTAIDYVQKNVSQIAKKNKNIVAKKGDARKLKLDDESFDISIVFGPLYHLFSHEDKLKVIYEASRVTKKGGYVLLMYLLNDYAVIVHAFKDGNLQDCIKNNKLDKNFQCVTNKEDLYSYVRVDEIKKLSSESALTSLKMIGVDGATDYIRPTINKMSEEDFEIYKNYQLSICERPELLGASSHLMEILRK